MNRYIKYIICLAVVSLLPSITSGQDHLEPLQSTNLGAIATALLHESTPRVWMIASPSFSGQYAIILDEQIEYKETNNPITDENQITNRQFVLKYVCFSVKPKRKSKSKRYFDGMRWEYEDINMSRDIEHYWIRIEEDFAETIEGAWASVLKQTKYPEKHRLGLDGTTFVFNYDKYYGRIWSPRAGLCEKIVELGNKLGTLVKSEEKDRELIKAQCLELATEIIRTNPNQQVDPIVTTPVDKVEAQGTQGHP